MGLFLLKLGSLAMLVLFGAGAIFVGAIVGYVGLRTGELSIGYLSDGREVTRIVSQQAEPWTFWLAFVAGSVLPLLGGGLAVRYGRRRLNNLGEA